MAQAGITPSKRSNSYNIFILVLTVLSLLVMVAMLLPLSDATIQLLSVYDTLICIIFLIDFFITLRASPNKSEYFIKDRGWLDLIGSLPSLGILGFPGKLTGFLRLARLSRLARIARRMRGENQKSLMKDVRENRSQYTIFITILMALIVLTVSSVAVLQFESKSPDANIHTGGDALWYSLVTITTVGYGDRYPVTVGGRFTAFFIMIMGVGIIGALASILSSMLVGSSPTSEQNTPNEIPSQTVEKELLDIKNELAELRKLLSNNDTDMDKK